MRLILVAALVFSLFMAPSVSAVDPSKPTKAGPTTAPPSGGTTPPGSGGTTPPPSGGSGGSVPPSFFSDAAGQAMARVYCRVGEPCDVAARFTNIGAPLAAGQPIPDPVWTIKSQPITPASVQRLGSGPGWATQEVKQWTARFTIAAGAHQLVAVLPRLATEKKVGNNTTTIPVTVGQSDMAVKIERDSVDAGTRYEVKVEVSNKGSVPTRALAMTAVLVVNVTHLASPPTTSQCLANPTITGCVVERHTVDPLAPGDTKRWKIGAKQLATTTVRAHAEVRCKDPGPCGDQNPENNAASKTYGP